MRYAIGPTEILARFLRGEGQGAPGVSGYPALRPPVVKALDIVGQAMRLRADRRLALEIINLFPAATVEAMLDAGRDEGLAHLRERYSRLSSDLSFIGPQPDSWCSRPPGTLVSEGSARAASGQRKAAATSVMNRSHVSLVRATEPSVKSGTMISSAPSGLRYCR